MKFKQLQQVLEDETIKIAYNNGSNEEVILAVSTKPLKFAIEDIDEQSVIKELSEMLKKMLTKYDIEHFFMAFNLIPGMAKDFGGSNKDVQSLRKWLESFGGKNLTNTFNDIIKVLRKIVKLYEEEKEEDLFYLIISPTVTELTIVRADINELRKKVLLPTLTGTKKISASELIKIADKLAAGMKPIKEELEKVNENLSKGLFNYIEYVAKIAFLVETIDRIVPPGLLPPSDWKRILKDAAELKEVIRVAKNMLESIKHQYKEEGKEHIVSDILNAFDLPRLTGGESDTSKWIKGWLDSDESEDSYGGILSRLRSSVLGKVWMGESKEDSDDQIVKVPVAIDFQEVFIESYNTFQKIVEWVSAKIETYPEEEKEKIVDDQDFRSFAKIADDINSLFSILKEKFEVIAGSRMKVYPILTSLTEKARQLLYKILEAVGELLYHTKKLDYHFFAETNYNLEKPYEALLQFLSDLALEYSLVYDKFRLASKDKFRYLYGKRVLEKLREAVKIYKQTLHNYIVYLTYQKLANGGQHNRDVYNELCVTDVKTVIGNPGDAEREYIDKVLERASRTSDKCSVTLYVFLKEMEDLIEKEGGKDLEILPFSIQHARDVLYRKVEDNLAAIASIVRVAGGYVLVL
jgi:hypothetical protein